MTESNAEKAYPGHEERTLRRVVLIVAIILAHVLLVLRVFPPGLLVRGELPLGGDVSRYFASTHSAVKCGGMYGYDPHFMAGFGAGLWDSVGRKGFQMLHLICPFLPLPALFYLTIVLLTILSPVLVWVVMRRYYRTATHSVVLLVLYMTYWHLDTQLSYLWHFGNIFYPSTCMMLLILAICGWEFLSPRMRWRAGPDPEPSRRESGGVSPHVGPELGSGRDVVSQDGRPSMTHPYIPNAASREATPYTSSHVGPDRGVALGQRVFFALIGSILSVIIFYSHPDLLTAGVLALAVCVVFRPGALRNAGTWVAATMALVLFLLLTVPWLFPLMQNRGDYQPLLYEGYQATWKHFVMDAFSDRAYGHPFDRNLLLHVAVVFGCAGLWCLRRDADRLSSHSGDGHVGPDPEPSRRASGLSLRGFDQSVFSMLGVVGVLYLLIAYGASHIRVLQQVEPYRFVMPAVVFLCAPASVFVVFSVEKWKCLERDARIVLAAVVLCILPAFTAYLMDLKSIAPASTPSTEQIEAMDYLRSLNMRGRLLCDDIHFGHLIPHNTGVSILGGSSAHALIRQGFAGFDYEERLFGRAPHEWTDESLVRYLGFYNAEMALFLHEGWIKRAEAAPGMFVLDRSFGPYRLYKIVASAGYRLSYAGHVGPDLVSGPGITPFDVAQGDAVRGPAELRHYSAGGYVVDGLAEASANYNSIAVSNVAARECVLKFHYEHWLEASNGVRLEPQTMLDDPAPFIKCIIPDGVRSFVISRKRFDWPACLVGQ